MNPRCPYLKKRQAGNEAYYWCDLSDHPCEREYNDADCEEYNDFLKEEESMEESKKVYKPLVETLEGKLVSVWAGGEVSRLGVILEYKEGGITYTPEGGAGIWVSKTLEEAQNQKNNQNKKGTFVVYEVTPLGKKCGEFNTRDGYRSVFSNDLRYPTVLLGKEVWREKPREEWVDVTEECEFKSNSTHIIAHHNSKDIGAIGIMPFAPFCSSQYKVEVGNKICSPAIQCARIFRKVTR